MKIEIDTEKKEIVFREISTLSDLVSCIDDFTPQGGCEDYRVFVLRPTENANKDYSPHSVNAILGTEFNPNFYNEPTTC